MHSSWVGASASQSRLRGLGGRGCSLGSKADPNPDVALVVGSRWARLVVFETHGGSVALSGDRSCGADTTPGRLSATYA